MGESSPGEPHRLDYTICPSEENVNQKAAKKDSCHSVKGLPQLGDEHGHHLEQVADYALCGHLETVNSLANFEA